MLGKKRRSQALSGSVDISVPDRTVGDSKFAPHQSPPDDWRNISGSAGMLEDNFS